MIPGSDTAKQDILLVVAGAVAAVLFFWFIRDVHPDSNADVSLREGAAEQISSNIFRELGYLSSYTPYTQFKANRALLDSLQQKTNLREYYTNTFVRDLNPGYYWQTILKTGEAAEDPEIPVIGSPSETVSLRLSESGQMMAFINDSNVMPEFHVSPVLQAILDDEAVEAAPGSLEDIQFQILNRESRQTSDISVIGESIVLGTPHAEILASYYLERSVWPEEYFEVESVEVETRNSLRIARVNFRSSAEFLEFPVHVSIFVLPSGQLFESTYSFEFDKEQNNTFEVTFQFLQIVSFMIAGVWVLILLFARFRMRLIDMKAAILVAVLAGIIVPFTVFLQLAYQSKLTFNGLGFTEFLSVLIPVGFIAAFASIAFFVVTAISDSITRKAWREKLLTVDFFRVGFASNVAFGLNLVKGIAYGFIIAAVWVISLRWLPDSYISGTEDVFQYYVSYFSFLSEILGNFFTFFMVAQVVFLVFTGLMRSASKSPFALIALPALVFALLATPFPVSVGPTGQAVAISAITGLILGWIYYRDDFLTVFIALFVFGMSVSTAPGWVTENSPDAFSFYLFLILTALGLLVGAVMIFKGTAARELPDFVPEYIRELAQEDRIKQELQIARKVQQSFLPVQTPRLKGFDIAAICKPAHETGGDYYDFIPLDDGALAVTIGDVSGKGIQAAFFMTFTKGILHSLCNDYKSTIDVLTKANKLFRKNADRGTFMSLIFGVLKPGEQVFSFSRAGHNPLLYFDAATKTLHEYKPEGLAIGMTDEQIFLKHISEQQIQLKENDLIILFTDGVVESVSKTNKVYGDSRLFNLIKKNHHLPAEKLMKKIEDDLKKFEEMSEQHDDMTMIIIKKSNK